MKVFLVVLLIIHYGSMELFTSLSDLENLLDTEKEVINLMNSYINAEETKLIKLKRALRDLRLKHSDASLDGPSYLANPINSYLLVKRLSTDWNQIKLLITDNENRDPIVNVTYHRSDLVFPDVEDLHGAALALIRLQETYNLDSAKLAGGRIDGAKPTMSLNGNDCFELGRQSYANEDYKHTIDWMTQALKKVENEDPMSIGKADVLEYVAFSYYLQGNTKEALRISKVLLEEDPEHARVVGNIAHYKALLKKNNQKKRGDDGFNERERAAKIEADSNPIPEGERYEKLCRGEKLISASVEARLKCRWFQCDHPYCILVRFKEEEAFLKPRIVRYYDVLTDHEISVIQTLAFPRLQRATVQHHETGELITASYRISKSAWLREYDHQIITNINQKIALLSGLDVRTGEDLQVANYGLGGHYEPHYDFAREDEKKAFESLGVGNRIATMLFYMSNLEAGGSTVFTKIGVNVKPIKGSAVFWFNLMKSGFGDYLTRHAACPVLAGNKWVCNKWLHEYGQEFLHPCSLDQEE